MKQQGKHPKGITLPIDAARILDHLDRHGGTSYVVGGCVRDSFLGRTPKDWDITTSLTPHDVTSLFKNIPGAHVIPTGIQHGTVTVIPPNSTEGYEITTFRTDGNYSDGRHPDSVQFARTIEEDLSRRDLTINAMAWSPKNGLCDPYGGMDDLKQKRIRTVSSPDDRFQEDALRMMRAVRFTAQLGFSMDDATKDAITRNASLIEQVSQERRQDELMKILKSGEPGKVRMLEETGLLQYVVPEVHALFSVGQNNPWHLYTVGEHTMKALDNTPPDPTVRLAVLFHDIGKAYTKTTDDNGIDHFHGHAELSEIMAKEAMRRMKFPNEAIHTVSKLVGIHDLAPEPTQKSVRRFAAKHSLDKQEFLQYYSIVNADGLAQNPVMAAQKLADNGRVLAIYKDIENQPMTVRDLQLNGHDMMALGYKGPAIGKALNGLLESVLDNPELNTRENLLAMMQRDETAQLAI